MRPAYIVIGALGLLLGACSGSPHHRSGRTPTTSVQQSVPSGHSDDDGSVTLHGKKLAGHLGVQLINGDTLTDLDTHTTQTVAGLPPDNTRATTAFRVGHDNVLSVDCTEGTGCVNKVFVLSPGGSHARLLASDVSGAPGASGVWLTRYGSDKHCTLSEMTVGGRTLVPPTTIDCGLSVRMETPLGVLATGPPMADVLLDPHNHLRPRIQVNGQILAVSGTNMVTADGQDISVVNRAGHATPVGIPSTTGSPGRGLVSPNHRYAAVSFANPNCPGPRQCLDVWLLNLTTLHWMHAPSMPTYAALKEIKELWSPDDRLIMVGPFTGAGELAAVWRPGATELMIRKTPLPQAQYGVING